MTVYTALVLFVTWTEPVLAESVVGSVSPLSGPRHALALLAVAQVLLAKEQKNTPRSPRLRGVFFYLFIMQNLHNSILHHGDADSFLPTIPSGSIRLVLTDPPYNVSRKNNLKTMNRRGIDFGEWDKGFDQLAWLENAAQALMPSGSIVIWNDVKNLGFIGRHLEGLGFDVKTYLTFYKRNPIPRNMKRRFLQSTEHALWAVKKSRHKWVFNIREGESYENGVFTYPVQRDAHPNKKPNDMFVSLIKILSNENEWILDPFCGSGTTCYAAEVTKRKFVAIEKKLEYFEQAQLLWDEARSLSKM